MSKIWTLLCLLGSPLSVAQEFRVKLPHVVVDQGDLGVCTLMSSAVNFDSVLGQEVSRSGLMGGVLREVLYETLAAWNGPHDLELRLRSMRAELGQSGFFQALSDMRVSRANQYAAVLKFRVPLARDWRGPDFLAYSEAEVLAFVDQVVKDSRSNPPGDRDWAVFLDEAFLKWTGVHPREWGVATALPPDLLFGQALLSKGHPDTLPRILSSVLRDDPVGVSLDMSTFRIFEGRAILMPRSAAKTAEPHMASLVGLEFDPSTGEILDLVIKNSWGSKRHGKAGEFRISWVDFWDSQMSSETASFTFVDRGVEWKAKKLFEKVLELLSTRPRQTSWLYVAAQVWKLSEWDMAKLLEHLKTPQDLQAWGRYVAQQDSKWRQSLLDTGYLFDSGLHRKLSTLLNSSSIDPREFFERALGDEFSSYWAMMGRLSPRPTQRPGCPGAVAPFLRLSR
jgi:hypothetical protein